MNTHLQKSVRGLVLLAVLYSLLHCGGEKKEDISTSLFLLNAIGSSETSGTADTEEFLTTSKSESSNGSLANSIGSQDLPDLTLINPPLFSSWRDEHNQHKTRCMTSLILRIRNIGKGSFRLNDSQSSFVITKANLKSNHGKNPTDRKNLKDLLPGESLTVEFNTEYFIPDIDDPLQELKITAELVGIDNESSSNNNMISVSSKGCGIQSETDLPDLTISLDVNDRVTPGEEISSKIIAKVANFGNGFALGNGPANEGYMVDYIISKDQIVPEGYAVYSSTFKEDALLRGGRISNTPDRPAGSYSLLAREAMYLPNDIPLGKYYFCARIDPGKKANESDETNNAYCRTIEVISDMLPDLTIINASISLSGECHPQAPVLLVTADIKNIGKTASEERLDVGMISAMHTDVRNVNWGNGAGIPAILPGQTIRVTFPIYYLMGNPSYMEGSHSFQLEVNRSHWIDDWNPNNNRYHVYPEITIPSGLCIR
ncbi:CARDB domain protein [Leptospira sp. 201903070]|uniref:CARDB domain protein n=1 Tax=Leptospira ainlahdjerensis TaxID=2810033 RepID=A0ABS2U6P5_9LEPT|nr:CARDB domain protein [Leptospira ainlahdjerensis]MBM9576044.1 CARDB domain protein [Leptospira ainlahdjerensis]